MKRTTMAAACAVLTAGVAIAELIPESLTLTWYRGEATNAVSTNAAVKYFTESTILLTNCVARIATNTLQDLTGCGINVRVGNALYSSLWTGTVSDATAGLWTATITLPAVTNLQPSNIIYSSYVDWRDSSKPSTTVRLQLSITNGAGVRYTYGGDKIMTLRAPLGD